MSFQELWPSQGVNDIGTNWIVVSFESNGSSNPADSSLRGGFISSITRNADGDWSIDLVTKDFVFQVLEASCNVKQSSDGTATALYGEVYWDEDATGGTSVRVFTKTSGGTKTNPGAGRRIQVALLVKSSSLGYSYT